MRAASLRRLAARHGLASGAGARRHSPSTIARLRDRRTGLAANTTARITDRGTAIARRLSRAPGARADSARPDASATAASAARRGRRARRTADDPRPDPQRRQRISSHGNLPSASSVSVVEHAVSAPAAQAGGEAWRAWWSRLGNAHPPATGMPRSARFWQNARHNPVAVRRFSSCC